MTLSQKIARRLKQYPIGYDLGNGLTIQGWKLKRLNFFFYTKTEPVAIVKCNCSPTLVHDGLPLDRFYCPSCRARATRLAPPLIKIYGQLLTVS